MGPYLITFLLLILAGIGKAIADAISHKYGETIFARFPKLEQWTNPHLSWRNKWKNGNPSEGERFWFSSTILVWVTDLWHFSNTIASTSVQIALALHIDAIDPLADTVGYSLPDLPGWVDLLLNAGFFKLLNGAGFVPFYNYLLIPLNMKKLFQRFIDWLTIDGRRTQSLVIVFGGGLLLAGIGSLLNHLDPNYEKFDLDPMYLGDWFITIAALLVIAAIVVTVLRKLLESDSPPT